MMALATPPPPRSPRLRPSDVAVLGYVFCDLEAEIGLRSLHGAQVDAMLGFRGTGSRHYLSPVEVWACWSREGIRRGQRGAYKALLRMVETRQGSKWVTVLYRVYGPRDPNARYDLFGDVAPLAEYTDAVEHTARRLGYAPTREALHRRLSVQCERRPEESKSVYAQRQLQLRGERVQFLAAVRRDAEQLLGLACEVYARTLAATRASKGEISCR
jgi:hypothetical protein